MGSIACAFGTITGRRFCGPRLSALGFAHRQLPFSCAEPVSDPLEPFGREESFAEVKLAARQRRSTRANAGIA